MAQLPQEGTVAGRNLAHANTTLTVGLITVVSAVAFEEVAVATVLPAASRDLGWPNLYGWAFSAFLLSGLVSIVVGSDIADREGPLRPFLASLALFAVGLIMAGSAPTMPLFIAGRAVQGSGSGAIAALAYLCVSRGYRDHMRPRLLALLSSAWVLPALIGPALAGLAADRASWWLAFFTLVPIVVLAGVMMLPALRGLGGDASAERSATGRGRQALRLAAGAALFLAALDTSGLWLVLPLAATGLWLGAPALRRLFPEGTLTARPGLPAALAVKGLLTFGYFGIEAFLPLGLTQLRGLTATEAGTILTAAGLSWTAGSWLQARLDRRDAGMGRALRVRLGMSLVLAGGALAAAGVLITALPPWLTVCGWAVGGLGMGIVYPTISVVVLGLAAAGEEGAVSAAL
ncbi:MAG TPA: MFS transporter, partial [Dehalococcoidia bacterium]